MGFLNRFSDIAKSIFVIKFYRKIYDQTFKRSLVYILVFSLLIYIAGAFANIIKFDSFIKREGKLFVESLPKFSIREGKLNVGMQEPIKVLDSSKHIMIDTLNSINLSEFKDKGWFVVFREREIAAGKNDYYKIVSYEWIMNKVHIKSIDKNYLLFVLPFIRSFIKKYLVLFYILGYIFWLFFYKSISVLFFSLIGSIVNSIERAKLEYKQILNISMYAVTLPWILKVTCKIIDFNLKFGTLIYVLVYWTTATIYMYAVIKDIKKLIKVSNNFDNPYNVKITI